MPKLPNKLSANTPEAVMINQIIDYLRATTPCDSASVKRKFTPFGVLFEATIGKNGPTGWHFESKIEADPTQSYPEQTVIHLQPDDPLVTTGIRDAANPSGGLVKSCAGFWVSRQAVPAKTEVSGNEVWNLPQYPYPEPTDLDDESNYWIYLGEIDCTPT